MSIPANSLNITQAGIVTFNGINAFTGSTVTQHDVLVGGASNAVTSIANGTTGQVLTATTDADPSWADATGIVTIDGDSDSATGSTISLEAYAGSNNSGASVTFSASGSAVTLNLTDGNNNTFLGNLVGNNTLTGVNNIIVGGFGNNITTGSQNVGSGDGVFTGLTEGTYNVAIGSISLENLTTGSYNLCLGYGGANYRGAETSNLLFNSGGSEVENESNVLRIGSETGSGNAGLLAAYICGITGISVTGSPVIVSSSNQLGVTVSSRRYKKNIRDMGDASDPVMKLRPVTFEYKGQSEQQYGLIAEEVHEIMPELVCYDKEGLPQTVQYHNLPAILLNEIKKLEKRVEELENSKK